VNKNREQTEQSRYDRDHAHARLLELEHSDLIEFITLTSVSVRLQDYGRGCIHRLVHRLDEARTEWDVVVLYKLIYTTVHRSGLFLRFQLRFIRYRNAVRPGRYCRKRRPWPFRRAAC
jgi:hypothetical protein